MIKTLIKKIRGNYYQKTLDKLEDQIGCIRYELKTMKSILSHTNINAYVEFYDDNGLCETNYIYKRYARRVAGFYVKILKRDMEKLKKVKSHILRGREFQEAPELFKEYW